MKLNFEKIELQKMDISLISLENGEECCIFCAKRAFVHFGIFSKNGQITQFGKILWKIPLFAKNLGDYHYFKTQVMHVTRVLIIVFPVSC